MPGRALVLWGRVCVRQRAVRLDVAPEAELGGRVRVLVEQVGELLGDRVGCDRPDGLALQAVAVPVRIGVAIRRGEGRWLVDERPCGLLVAD